MSTKKKVTNKMRVRNGETITKVLWPKKCRKYLEQAILFNDNENLHEFMGELFHPETLAKATNSLGRAFDEVDSR